jgi:hypothetical protein
MKYLRQYIRQALITEGAFTPEDLPDHLAIRIRDDGELFDVAIMKKTKGYTTDGSGWIMSSEIRDVGGEIQAYKVSNQGYGRCLDAYMISYSTASDGWGPLLYDIAIELATLNGSGLIADRESVSKDAEGVWRYYMNRRSGDVDNIQLDNMKDSFENGPEDDCDQDVPMDYEGPNGWQDSPLSKMYKKSPASTIEKLRLLGKLVEE